MSSIRQRRLCFESALSAKILENPEYFTDIMTKVSERIVALLTHPLNEVFLSENQILTDNIITQLYSDTHFGTLDHAIDYCPSQDQFIQTVKDVLSSKQANLPRILHLHQIFMQSIFDKLAFQSEDSDWKTLKENLISTLFKNELFNKPRIKINELAGELTTIVGIAGNIDCPETSTTDIHRNILGMFAPNSSHPWTRIVEQHELPFVAGPSGHTGSAILLALIVGKLNPDELKTYVSATMGMLIAGGYHSADEVMTMANRTGITYVPGEYHRILPQPFLCSKPVMELATHYPDLLAPELCTPPIAYLQNDNQKSDTAISMVTSSAAHGFIRGLSNVIYESAITKNLSKNTAFALQQFVYYSSFFGMRFTQHYTSDEVDNCLNAMYQSALETGQLLIVNTVMNTIMKLFDQSFSHNMRPMSNLLSFGLFSYSAWSNGLSTTAVNTVANAATQAITESLGKRFY